MYYCHKNSCQDVEGLELEQWAGPCGLWRCGCGSKGLGQQGILSLTCHEVWQRGEWFLHQWQG